MRSHIHNPAILQDHDAVRAQDGGEPVGDDNAGPVLHQVFQGLLHDALRFGIQGACGLVQDQERWILEQGPGDGDALLLAPGEDDPSLADNRIVSLGELHDPLVNGGDAANLLQAGGIHIVHAVEDVVPNGHIEEHGLLGHDPYEPAQAAQRVFGQGPVIDLHRSVLRVVEARQELDHARLARPAGPHDGHPLLGSHMESDVPHCPVRGSLIGEPEALIGELFQGRRKLHASTVLLGDLPGVQKTEDALRPGQGLLYFHIGLAEALEGVVEHEQGGEKGEEVARCGLAGDHLGPPVPDDQSHAHATDHLH